MLRTYDVNNQSDIYPRLTSKFAEITQLNEQQIQYLPAISDGGSTAHIISLQTAQKLIERGIIPKIIPIEPGVMSVLFGKSEATEPVIGEIMTNGILKRVLVVKDIATTLISESSLTNVGVIFLKDDTSILGLYKGRVVLRGERNPDALEGSIEQLWNIDLATLFQEPSLDIVDHSNFDKNNNKEEMYMSLTSFLNVYKKSDKNVTNFSNNDNNGMYKSEQIYISGQTKEEPSSTHSFSARPQYTQPQVREARRWISNCNNTPAEAIAKAVDAQAWSNIPPDITGDIFREIGARRDNLPYLLTHSQRNHPGGSGIRSNIPGEVIHMDIQGKLEVDPATHATFLLIILDECSLWGKAYAIKNKFNSRDAVMLWNIEMRSYGRKTTKVRTDFASEVTNDFLRDINKQLAVQDRLEILISFKRYPETVDTGIQVDKAAPEEYAKLFERTWQTYKKAIANAMLNQRSLNKNYYQFAAMDVIDRRNGLLNSTHPTMTPMQQVTGRKPDANQMTAFRYGGLGITPRIGQSNKISETNFELVCVVASPQMRPGLFLVLREGTKVPVIRGDVRPILEHDLRKTPEQWDALKPKFDKHGRMTHFESAVNTIFSLDDLLQQYRGIQHSGPDKLTSKQRDALDIYKGRVGKGGAISIQNNRQESGRTMRSDSMKSSQSLPLPEHVVRNALSSSGATTSIESNTSQADIVCLPTPTINANGTLSPGTSNLDSVSNESSQSGSSDIEEGDSNDKKIEDSVVEDETDTTDNDKVPIYWSANYLETITPGTNPNCNPNSKEDRHIFNSSGIQHTFKARVVRTDANPTLSQIMKSERLQIKWSPSIREFIDEGLKSGIHRFISHEDIFSGGHKYIPHVNVFDTKRNGTLKYRLTPDGSCEPVSDFLDGSLASSGIDSPALNQLIAHGASFGMAFSSSDVAGAFPNHNWMDDEAVKNPRKVYTRLSAFQSGTGQEEFLEFLTVTNGFRDASAIWEEIYARAIFKWGGIRSVVCRALYYKHDGNEGFMAVGAYVDDSAKMRTRNEEGTIMHKELSKILVDAGFKMKDKELDEHEEGIDFAGRLIKNVSNEYGTGIALTQPSMHIKIQEFLKEMREDDTDKNWMPISNGWTPLMAAQGMKSNIERISPTIFLSLLGMVLWTNQTAIRGPVPSILSSYSRNPGKLDFECLVAAAKHFLATSHIPLVYYRDLSNADIREPANQHAYVDAGETGETDGSGRKSIIIKYGTPGTPSGGIIISTNKVKHSNSTPADEAEALADAIGRIITTRAISEEFAGLRKNAYDTEEILSGSPNPTAIYIGGEMADCVNSTETDDTDCIVRTQTVRRLQMRKVQFPTVVFEDNEIVAKIANADGTIKIAGLRSALRQFGAIHRATKDGVIKVVKIASQNNLSNQLSKLPSSQLAHALGLEGMVGKSPQMDEFRALAIAKFGKTSKATSHQSTTPMTDQKQKNIAMVAIPAWTQSTSKGVSHLHQKSGYFAAHLQQPTDNNVQQPTDNKLKAGIGYITAVAAISAKATNYSAEYLLRALPDPQSTSTEEADAWNVLVQSNSNINANPTETEFFERKIAAKGSMQIQIHMVHTQKELEDLEQLQRDLTLHIARNKVILSASNNNKRGIDNSVRESQRRREERRRDEEKVIRQGVRFLAISSSEEYVDPSITDDMKKQRKNEKNSNRQHLDTIEDTRSSTQISVIPFVTFEQSIKNQESAEVFNSKLESSSSSKVNLFESSVLTKKTQQGIDKLHQPKSKGSKINKKNKKLLAHQRKLGSMN